MIDSRVRLASGMPTPPSHIRFGSSQQSNKVEQKRGRSADLSRDVQRRFDGDPQPPKALPQPKASCKNSLELNHVDHRLPTLGEAAVGTVAWREINPQLDDLEEEEGLETAERLFAAGFTVGYRRLAI
jgi:hypothetical protein